VLGRSFSQEEDLPGGSRVVLISQRRWEQRFGSDPGIIGHKLVVDGQSATVIGVLARIIGRSYYASYEVWAPLVQPTDSASRETRTLEVVGLLKSGPASPWLAHSWMRSHVRRPNWNPPPRDGAPTLCRGRRSS
jgi:hypothetical protein